MAKTTLGGKRLGSGNDMLVNLPNYGRSTHDLGKVIRTTQATGTLVPIYSAFVKKGDVWEINLKNLMRTWPTNGPIFGSWKMQIDVFTADLRLYQRSLHNDIPGLGLEMDSVYLPLIELTGNNPSWEGGDMNVQQIDPSSFLAYSGIRGLGTKDVPDGEGDVTIRRNAIKAMMYPEIYSYYYANQQEGVGYVISPKFSEQPNELNTAFVSNQQGQRLVDLLDMTTNHTVTGDEFLQFEGRGITPENTFVNFAINTTDPTTTFSIQDLQDQGYGNIIIVEEGRTFGIADIPIGSLLAPFGTQGVGATVTGSEFRAEEGIFLEEFELSVISDMRERVFLQAKTSPLILTSANVTQPYTAMIGHLKPTGQQAVMHAKAPMSGLFVKTYQSNYLNNWLKTEWIDRINAKSSVDTSSGSFSMAALEFAKAMYKNENAIAAKGGTYEDWVEATTGESMHGAPEMPVYRGGMSAEIVFEEVVSSSDATTASGDDQPLGTLGGRGTADLNKGGSIRWKADQHSMVMVIASLTPREDQCQGNAWENKLLTMDDIHKPAFDGIGFQDLTTDQMAAWDTKVADDGTETFFSAGKQPAWTHYTTTVNEIYGNFAKRNQEMFMVLPRNYESDENGRIADLTTYIDPTKFNHGFAQIDLEAQPFWAQYSVDAKVRRIMSASLMPK